MGVIAFENMGSFFGTPCMSTNWLKTLPVFLGNRFCASRSENWVERVINVYNILIEMSSFISIPTLGDKGIDSII